jgi:hypothetical protein
MNAARDERRRLRERGELEEARKVLLELRAEFPDDPHVAVQTAWVHDSLGLDQAMTAYNLGEPCRAVQQLLEVLLETTSDPQILRYRRSLSAYAQDLDRSWLS